MKMLEGGWRGKQGSDHRRAMNFTYKTGKDTKKL